MADRSVVLRFLSDTAGLKKGFSEAGKGAQDTEGVFARLEGKLGGVSAGMVASAAGIAGVTTSIVGFATAAVKRLGEEEVAAARTGAVILSTGGAAQVTAGHVGTMAASLAKLSGVDDEVVQAGENMLLSFTNIQNGVGAGNDIFDQATKAALNMSVALGTDMATATTQLGKALQDPIAGMTALRRAGVLLTDDQKKAIQAFVATNDIVAAQKVILDELTKKFGGAAEAYGTTLPGAIGRAKTAFENFAADTAKKAFPVIESVAGAFGDVGKAVGPTLVSGLETVGGVITSVGKFAKDHAGFVIAAAVAYTAFLIPAVYRSVVAFAALRLEQVGVVLGLMAGKVVALAAEMGVLNLALSATVVGAAVVGFGYLIERFITADSKAKALAATLTKGLDLSTIAGAQQGLANIYSDLAKAQMATAHHGNPIIDFLTFKGLDRHDAMAVVSTLQAQAKALEDQVAMVKSVAKEFGISTGAVEAYAKANGIDLTGPVAETTAKIEDQYRATLEATKGWTGYGISVEDAVAIQKTVTDAFEAATDPVKEYSTALQAAQDATKTGAKAQADSIRDQARAQRDALDTRHDAEKAALDSEFITGKASKAAHDQRVKALEAQQKVENDAADATVAAEGKRATAIENTKVQTSLSMEAYRKAIEANTKSTMAWMTNLALIASRPGGAAIEGQLAQLGPSQAALVAQVAASTKPAFDKFASTMEAAGKTAIDATAEEFNKLPGEVQTIARTSGQQFADTLVHQVALGLKPLSAIVTLAATDAVNAAIAAMQAQATADAAALHAKNEEREAGMGGVAPPGTAKPAPKPLTGSYQPGLTPIVPRAEGHYAEIAPAGSWRVWAEPETGGEAYIPLAASKRGGAMAVFAQVANAFGQAVVPMAAGGTWGVPLYSGGASSGAGGYGSSIAALERAVAVLESTSAKRRPVEMHNSFPQGVDPLHVARKIAWQLG